MRSSRHQALTIISGLLDRERCRPPQHEEVYIMAEGIKDKVAIIGMGCTKFGERWESGVEDLIVEAFMEALEDAGIEKKDLGGCLVRLMLR